MTEESQQIGVPMIEKQDEAIAPSPPPMPATEPYDVREHLTLYQSHKVVRAAKITDVAVTFDTDGNFISAMLEVEKEAGPSPVFARFMVDSDYVQKHDPQVGGYYVRYEDGYESFSPAEAFEAGYDSLVEDTPPSDNGDRWGAACALAMTALDTIEEIDCDLTDVQQLTKRLLGLIKQGLETE